MKKSILFFGLIASAIIFSCSDDDNNNNSNDTLTDRALLTAYAIADYSAESDFQAGMEAARDEESMRSGGDTAIPIADCAVVTVATEPGNTFPKTFTINFGTGCQSNGVSRSGLITVNLTGPLMQAGTVMTITRTNYKINNYLIEGTVTYTNNTTSSDTPQWTRTVTNGTVTNPAGIEYDHSGTRTIRQIEGANTLLVLTDNVYEVTSGSHTITSSGGATLTAEVDEPLIKNYSCFYISQGVLDLNGSFLNGSLNYGAGTCDNTAVYTHSDGEIHTVYL